MKIVIDDGSNFIKVKTATSEFKFESRVMQSPVFNTDGTFSSESYEVSREKYAVCRTGVNLIDTNNEEYQTSPHNRVLIHEAIRRAVAGTDTKEVQILVTLPVERLFGSKGNGYNKHIIEQKKANCMGAIRYLDDSPTIKITECKVVAEGIPAFIAASSELKLKGERFIIADIGGYTTDVIIIDKDYKIHDFRSFEFGVISALNELKRDYIKQEGYAEDSQIPDSSVLSGFISGSLGGMDISHLIKPIKQRFEQRFSDLIDDFATNMDKASFPDGLIVSGGGANMINPDNFNYQIQKTKSPQMDNANGAAIIFEVDK